MLLTCETIPEDTQAGMASNNPQIVPAKLGMMGGSGATHGPTTLIGKCTRVFTKRKGLTVYTVLTIVDQIHAYPGGAHA